MKTTDEQIMCALVSQVAKAAAGGPEINVRTIITRPMWRAFLRGCGTNPNSKPTEWKGEKTIRVFGSETIVVPGKRMISVSYSIQ